MIKFQRHFIYCTLLIFFVETFDTLCESTELHVIANFFSQGLGIVGDVVKVPKRMWRNFLSQARLATYPTPENIAELNKELQVK